MRDERFIREGLEVRFVTVNNAKDIVSAAQAVADPLATDDMAALIRQF
jgi:hypothetical protein